MTHTGDTTPIDKAPIRTCAGCRAKNAQARLLRFARRDDGHVVPANVTRDLRGRSAYSCPRRACLEQAAKRRAFARAFGTERRRVSVIDVDTDALWAATAEQLRREIDLLARTSASAAENSHGHHRRRGLEQLLSELSSQPKGPERTPKRGTTHSHANEGGAPNHG